MSDKAERLPNSKAQREFQTNIEKSFPRNAVASVAWEAIWGLGAGCCLLWTVVPAYLLSLGASKTLVQTVMIGFTLFVGLQLVGPKLIHGPRRKLLLYILWSLFPCLWLMYGLLAVLAWGAFPLKGWLIIFIVTCAGLATIMHLGAPSYGGFLLENIPVKKRGILGAWRSLALGVCGFLGIGISKRLMGMWPAPMNFHYSIIVGSSIMIISCLAILLHRDHAQAAHEETYPMSAVPAAKSLLKNFNFRVFVVFLAMYVAAQGLGPMFIGYGKDVLGMPPSEVAYFSGAYFMGPVLVGIFVSRLADKHGFRLVGTIGAALLTCAFVLPLVIQGSRAALLCGYALLSSAIMLAGLVLANLGSEMVPEVKPAIVIAVGSIIVSPVGLIIAPLSGWLADTHGKAGYLAVLVMGATLGFCALLGFLTVIREPRTGQEIYIRIRHV